MSRRFNFLRDFSLAALFSLAAFSCNLISSERLRAEVSIGENESRYEKEFLAIDFSLDVNKAQAESLVSLTEEESPCAAEFFWDKNLFRVRPKNGWKKGREYSFSLSGSLLASDGRSWPLDLWRKFIYGSAAEDFFVEQIDEPKKNDPQNAALVFLFSKPVNAASFEREFSLSPSAGVKKNYSADMRRVEISAGEKWKANRYYVWHLGRALSADGTILDKSHSGSFMAAEKTEPPKVLCVCPVSENGTFMEDQGLDCLWTKEGVGFVFDCGMDFESVKNGVYWSPLVDGYWTQASESRFVFAPYDNYKIGEEVLITISEEVEDLAGIKLAQSRNFRFAPRTEFITAKASLNGEPLLESVVNRIEAADIGLVIIRLEFSKALEENSMAGIKSALSLQAHFPSFASTPILESARPSANNSAVQLEYRNLDFCDGEDERIYRLRIFGGQNYVRDALGEYIKEDLCFYIALKKAP